MVRPLLPFEQQKGGSSVVVYPPDKVCLRINAADGVQLKCADSAMHKKSLQW